MPDDRVTAALDELAAECASLELMANPRMWALEKRFTALLECARVLVKLHADHRYVGCLVTCMCGKAEADAVLTRLCEVIDGK